MRPLLSILFFILVCPPSLAHDMDTLYQMLDATIENHTVYTAKRTKHLEDLKTAAYYNRGDALTLLRIYHETYKGYYGFVYDSAMVYVERGMQLARRSGNEYYLMLNTLHRAMLLASVGFYHDAQECISTIPSQHLPAGLLLEYYFTQYKLYSFWDNYYGDSEFKDKVHPRISFFLQKAIALASPRSLLHHYLLGEYYLLENQNRKAMESFQQVVSKAPQEDDIYGSAAYNLAKCHLNYNNVSMYEHYLILAAIGDIKSSTKENVALQDLAMFIFNHRKDCIAQADKYINFSMHDAQYYNSKLRMISISGKLPAIVSTYQQKLSDQNSYLRIGITLITILLLILVSLLYYITRQKNLLSKNRKELSDNYLALKHLNEEIKTKNKQLIDVNSRREGLAKVYIDLCADYIGRLKKFQILVRRKIKANQVRDILTLTSNTKLSDEEATIYLSKFDKAFLTLYPTFVEELNSLLRDECRFSLRTEQTMSMEQRVFALIRLGVRDSWEIAQLLFYSPQTVYNYRWGLKNRAKCRESFEDDVMHLCNFR